MIVGSFEFVACEAGLRRLTCGHRLVSPRSFAHLWWARLGLWSAISVRAAHLVVWTGRRESACLLASDAYPSFKSSMIHGCHTSSLSHFILHALAYLYNRSAECMLVCLPYLSGRPLATVSQAKTTVMPTITYLCREEVFSVGNEFP